MTFNCLSGHITPFLKPFGDSPLHLREQLNFPRWPASPARPSVSTLQPLFATCQPHSSHTPATLASRQFPEQPKPLPCPRALMFTASFPRTHWLFLKSQLKHFSSERSSLTALSKVSRIKCALFHYTDIGKFWPMNQTKVSAKGP